MPLVAVNQKFGKIQVTADFEAEDKANPNIPVDDSDDEQPDWDEVYKNDEDIEDDAENELDEEIDLSSVISEKSARDEDDEEDAQSNNNEEEPEEENDEEEQAEDEDEPVIPTRR